MWLIPSYQLVDVVVIITSFEVGDPSLILTEKLETCNFLYQYIFVFRFCSVLKFFI